MLLRIQGLRVWYKGAGWERSLENQQLLVEVFCHLKTLPMEKPSCVSTLFNSIGILYLPKIIQKQGILHSKIFFNLFILEIRVLLCRPG